VWVAAFTCHLTEVIFYAFIPAYCRYSFIDHGRMKGWVDLCGWLYTKMVNYPQTVTHPSINRARRRVTLLIDTNALPLSQATTATRPTLLFLAVGDRKTKRQNVRTLVVIFTYLWQADYLVWTFGNSSDIDFQYLSHRLLSSTSAWFSYYWFYLSPRREASPSLYLQPDVAHWYSRWILCRDIDFLCVWLILC